MNWLPALFNGFSDQPVALAVGWSIGDGLAIITEDGYVLSPSPGTIKVLSAREADEWQLAIGRAKLLLSSKPKLDAEGFPATDHLDEMGG